MFVTIYVNNKSEINSSIRLQSISFVSIAQAIQSRIVSYWDLCLSPTGYHF